MGDNQNCSKAAPAPQNIKPKDSGGTPNEPTKMSSTTTARSGKQQQHQQQQQQQPGNGKAARPYREIYRPPSLRSKNKSVGGGDKPQTNGGCGSLNSPPGIPQANGGLAIFDPRQIQNHQVQIALLSQLDPRQVFPINNQQTLMAQQQLLQAHHHQYLQQQQQQQQHFNRLSQSKSSGSIPDRPKVRFELQQQQQQHPPKCDNIQPSSIQIQRSKTSSTLHPQGRGGGTSGILKGRGGGMSPSISFPSSLADFHLHLWPQDVHEAVSSAAAASFPRNALPGRKLIELVSRVFEAMLEGGEALSTPAVNIFLYFIQRDKEQTVIESLLNTCFAGHQRVFSPSEEVRGESESRRVSSPSLTFLNFLSTLYTQVKLRRREKVSLDEMSYSILALLCDSCSSLLRSKWAGEPPSMGCLFTVMTSHGRDMEGAFPAKMKQLLASVRDSLLGLGLYARSCKGPLSASVQKTLMQIIELHAANWALPASAVRYYYSSN